MSYILNHCIFCKKRTYRITFDKNMICDKCSIKIKNCDNCNKANNNDHRTCDNCFMKIIENDFIERS